MATTETRQMGDMQHKSVASATISPLEAYIQWVCEAPFTGWNADPTQPCLLYKVYRDVPRIPLDRRFPLRLSPSPQPEIQPEQKLAWLLYYTHGLTRVIRPAPGSLPSIPPAHSSEDELPSLPRRYTGPQAHHHPLLARPIPSGGNLHPVEIYIAVGAQWTIPAGIYHYDSAHHALDQLRVGEYIADIAACLLEGHTAQSCPAILLPSCFFQKNHQKYGNMSYCLQNLDAGVAIEQLSFMARQFDFDTTLHLQFVDLPLHSLVGLDVREECIYAAIVLHPAATLPSRQEPLLVHTGNRQVWIDRPPLTATYVQPFTPQPLSDVLKNIHTASLMDKLPATPMRKPAINRVDETSTWLSLPAADCIDDSNLAEAILRRRTAFCAIDTRELEQIDLAAILASLTTLEDNVWRACACQVYCVIRRVRGLSEGVYRYSKERQALTIVHSKELLPLLMRLTTAPNIQPHLAPLNLFFSGDYLKARDSFGERGLRLMEIAIGRVIQRITLAAAVRKLASHTHRSYLLQATGKKLLRLPSSSQLPFASMVIGHAKTSQGGLFEAAWY